MTLTSAAAGSRPAGHPTAPSGAIPAMPLVLDAAGDVDWTAERALVRYYLACGVDGLAVGVHTTQFELHDDRALLQELWSMVRDEVADEVTRTRRPVTLIAGLCGDLDQADAEAQLARALGYDAGLLCSNGMSTVSEARLLEKARVLGETLPTVGFYLQEAVGGVALSRDFWQRLCDLETCVGIKAAPFDRYRTRDVASAILESDRWREVALLTGNDDAIVADLVTPHRRTVAGEVREIRCAGGLLGQFAVGARAATTLTHRALETADAGWASTELLALGGDLTEVNAAVFDSAHGFAGCVAGVNEVLRQQQLAPTSRCFGAREVLSPGQADLIAAARRAHPDLLDEDFIAEHRDEWRR